MTPIIRSLSYCLARTLTEGTQLTKLLVYYNNNNNYNNKNSVNKVRKYELKEGQIFVENVGACKNDPEETAP